MADMRRLASLFVTFQHQFQGVTGVPQNSLDMLKRTNFVQLRESVEAYTISEENTLKASLKLAIYYLLKRFAKVCKGMHLINVDDEAAAQVDKFVQVLELNYHNLFGDATYALNRNCQVKLRRPENLPCEEDVMKLRQYTVNRIQALLADPYKVWDSHSHVELRDLTVCRLTVFNARRDGEPAKLAVSEWKDAENNSWLNSSRFQTAATDSELALFRNLKVTYQSGKGSNHLVPVLIPSDVVAAMKVLSCPAAREMADVQCNNNYMFPCTQQSSTHVIGWQAAHRVCIDANVDQPDRLTATKMRHRVSTLYAAMDIPEAERQFFYKHMGHSEGINQNIYQAPLAESEVVKVGSHLLDMDGKLPGSCHDSGNWEDVEPDSTLADVEYDSTSASNGTAGHENGDELILPSRSKHGLARSVGSIEDEHEIVTHRYKTRQLRMPTDAAETSPAASHMLPNDSSTAQHS